MTWLSKNFKFKIPASPFGSVSQTLTSYRHVKNNIIDAACIHGPLSVKYMNKEIVNVWTLYKISNMENMKNRFISFRLLQQFHSCNFMHLLIFS